MALYDLQPGDMVYAAETLYNDGGVPGLPEDAVLAQRGARGVVVAVGHAEEAPNREIFLVRFENENAELGLPLGCLADELTDAPG